MLTSADCQSTPFRLGRPQFHHYFYKINTTQDDNKLLKLLSLVGGMMKYLDAGKLKKYLSLVFVFTVYVGSLAYLSRYIV
ncbi:hypothetical protein BS333_01645 [Vibrio azureus]|nr:hypothetical protein BS333_01645 [Vibrio azureus]